MGSVAGRMDGDEPAASVVDLGDAVGSGGHRWPTGPALRGGGFATRNLADAAYFLCVVHGMHPGLIDHVAAGLAAAPRDWLEAAAEAFAVERGLLARIVAAAGPLPSTPGHTESESTALAQRHALEMLGRSERAGCGLGAAAAMIVDWHVVRTVLDAAAERFYLSPTRCLLPLPEETLAFLREAGAGQERAVRFGAQQFLLQQQGLWSLLEARAAARRAG